MVSKSSSIPGGPPRAEPAAEPPVLIGYLSTQRQRTLAFTTWIVLLASLILGTFDIQFRTWDSVGALYGLAALCVGTLILNRRGHYRLAGSLLSLIVLLVVSINLYDGDGIRDPGLIAYPIFIMIGVLLFGRRAAPYFGAAAIVAVVCILVLETSGLIHPTIGRTEYDILIPIGTLLVAAAAIMWVILRNTERNLERVEESEAELRHNYELTIDAWARVLEYRDRETEGHSRRLVELSTRLAQALGMSDTEIRRLQRGALLHDVGKLAIPDEILLKPAALDEAELKIMQQHPVFARQMISGIPFLEPSIPVAYSHHERWDGQGYPEGLKGEQIPLAARLFAVVDAWDALGSERVYRPAWAREEITKYIAESAGTRFDPHIVEVFLRIMKEEPGASPA